MDRDDPVAVTRSEARQWGAADRLVGPMAHVYAPAMTASSPERPPTSPADDSPRARLEGWMAGTAAFVAWGLFPIYWRALAHVPALELVLHRAVWSAVLFVLVIIIGRKHAQLWSVLREAKYVRALSLTALLIGINFLTFIYAVETERVVQVSLGYFINPMFNVVLGVLVLRERLNRLGWAAVSVAGLGVSILATASHGFPWIALTLAVAFGLYGLVRKRCAIPSLMGNAIEMIILAVPCSIALLVLESGTAGHWSSGSASDRIWLASTGLVTALPLLLFTSAARRLPLSTVGFLQYIAPSLQLGIAVTWFGEPFTGLHALAFGCIWLALAMFGASLRQPTRARSG